MDEGGSWFYTTLKTDDRICARMLLRFWLLSRAWITRFFSSVSYSTIQI